MDLGAVGSSLMSLESGNMRCCSHFMDIRTLIKKHTKFSNLHDFIFMTSARFDHMCWSTADISRSREVLGQPRVCCVVAWSMKLRLWWPLNHRFFADNLLLPSFTLVYFNGFGRCINDFQHCCMLECICQSFSSHCLLRSCIYCSTGWFNHYHYLVAARHAPCHRPKQGTKRCWVTDGTRPVVNLWPTGPSMTMNP